MNSTTMIITVVLAVVIVVALTAAIFVRRNSAKKLREKFGTEYDHTVQVVGDEKKAQIELNERQKHVEALNIHPLTTAERDRYQVEWAEVQSKFVDQPGNAIMDADRLIMEVMLMRAYPVSDFEQRAADLSVNYPDIVTNYRAAHAIAHKNQDGKADTEELRQAMIYYRSLFAKLLETESVVA